MAASGGKRKSATGGRRRLKATWLTNAFGQSVKQHRERHGLSLGELGVRYYAARGSTVSPWSANSFIWKIEAGLVLPKLDTMQRLAFALDVTLSDLIGDDLNRWPVDGAKRGVDLDAIHVADEPRTPAKTRPDAPTRIARKDAALLALAKKIAKAPERRLLTSACALSRFFGVPEMTFFVWVKTWEKQEAIIRDRYGKKTAFSLGPGFAKAKADAEKRKRKA